MRKLKCLNWNSKLGHPEKSFCLGSQNVVLATGVLMGWRFGVKRIMSSYDFNSNEGPPTNAQPSEWSTAQILPPTTTAGSSDTGFYSATYQTQRIYLFFKSRGEPGVIYRK